MKTRIQDGMIRFEFDEAVLQTIEKALGDMKGQSRKVLKNAVNATAKQARSDLADKAKEEYMAKKSALNSSMKLGRATVSKPEATITVTGGTLERKKFKATTPRSGAKVQITTGGTLKLIQSRKGNKAKAFLATFASGHQAIVQRQYGKTYKTASGRSSRQEKWGRGADMTQIKKLLSISAPKMIGDEKKVFGVLRPEIYGNLMENIRREIDKVVNAT